MKSLWHLPNVQILGDFPKMKWPTPTLNLAGHIWLKIGSLLHGARKPRLRRRLGALQFESLEVRLAMYGTAFLDLAEGEAGSIVEEFSLTDVNPASDTFNQLVSPSDTTQHASAWYFGHAT